MADFDDDEGALDFAPVAATTTIIGSPMTTPSPTPPLVPHAHTPGSAALDSAVPPSPSLPSASSTLSGFFNVAKETYAKWALLNTESVSYVENGLRTVLFFLPGRFNDQELTSELLLSLAGMFSLVNDTIWSHFSLTQQKVEEEEKQKKDTFRQWLSSEADGDEDPQLLAGRFGDLGEKWAKQFGSLLSPQAPVKLSSTEVHTRGVLATFTAEFQQKLKKIARRLHPSLQTNFPTHFLLSVVNNFELVAEIFATQIQARLSEGIVRLPGLVDGDIINRVRGGPLEAFQANFRLVVIFFIEILKAGTRLLLLLKNGGRILATQKLPQKDTLLQVVEPPPPNFASKKRISLSAVQSAKDAVTCMRPTFYSILGEILWTLRPLIYLISMVRNGRNSWRPWMVSLVVDLASRGCTAGAQMSEAESNEMARRMTLWFFYLLRSPFYEAFMKDSAASKIADHLLGVPLLGSVTRMVSELLNVYRRWYFYTAGSSS